MELVRGVGQALPLAPAQRRQLRRRERLGDEGIVVDRCHVGPQPAQQRRKRVGGEHHPAGPYGARGGGEFQRGAVRPDGGDVGLLGDADACVQAGTTQPPRQFGGVEHRRGVAVPDAAEVGGRVQLRAGRLRVEAIGPQAEAVGEGRFLVEYLKLPGCRGHRQFAGAFPVAVDAQLGDGPLDGVEVAPAERHERIDLFGEAGQAVGRAVGEARRAETAVAAGRRLPARAAFQDQHIECRVRALGQQRGPQSRVPATDDREVRLGPPGQLGQGRRASGPVQPERHGLGVGQRRLTSKGRFTGKRSLTSKRRLTRQRSPTGQPGPSGKRRPTGQPGPAGQRGPAGKRRLAGRGAGTRGLGSHGVSRCVGRLVERRGGAS